MNKKLFSFAVAFVLIFTPFIFSTIFYNNPIIVEAATISINVPPATITSDSAQVLISGLTPGTNYYLVGTDLSNYSKFDWKRGIPSNIISADGTASISLTGLPTYSLLSFQVVSENEVALSEQVSFRTLSPLSPIPSKATLNVVPESITLNSAKLKASGNLTPGTYHFSVYDEAGYPNNRSNFQYASDPLTYPLANSSTSIEVTMSPLKPSTRYVGVLYKDNFNDISEVHFVTKFDNKITLSTKDLTSTSVTLFTLGTLDKDLYHFYIYDNTTSLANPLFTKDISRTTESGLEAAFSGLKSGHNYFGAIDFNMGIEYNQSVPPIQFTTPTSTTTPTPAVTSTPNSGVVPDCGKVVTTMGADGKEVITMNNPCGFKDLVQLINNIIKFLLFSIATPLIALILMYTGYLYLTAGGSSGQTEKVRHILFNAVIGYVVALAAWLIVKTILSSLNIDPTIETFLK